MHEPLSKAQLAAINATPATGIDSIPEAGLNPECGTDDEEHWFFNVCVAVFGPKETGWHLHHVTGWPRTSCYAMVARDPEQRRKPPAEFLRLLFRTPQGAPFHAAYMHGNVAKWWLDREREADVGRQILQITDAAAQLRQGD
jgi:hypothetical protein